MIKKDSDTGQGRAEQRAWIKNVSFILSGGAAGASLCGARGDRDGYFCKRRKETPANACLFRIFRYNIVLHRTAPAAPPRRPCGKNGSLFYETHSQKHRSGGQFSRDGSPFPPGIQAGDSLHAGTVRQCFVQHRGPHLYRPHGRGRHRGAGGGGDLRSAGHAALLFRHLGGFGRRPRHVHQNGRKGFCRRPKNTEQRRPAAGGDVRPAHRRGAGIQGTPSPTVRRGRRKRGLRLGIFFLVCRGARCLP